MPLPHDLLPWRLIDIGVRDAPTLPNGISLNKTLIIDKLAKTSGSMQITVDLNS